MKCHPFKWRKINSFEQLNVLYKNQVVIQSNLVKPMLLLGLRIYQKNNCETPARDAMPCVYITFRGLKGHSMSAQGKGA